MLPTGSREVTATSAKATTENFQERKGRSKSRRRGAGDRRAFTVCPVTVTIDELTAADDPDAWSALGFEVDGETCVFGEVRIRLAGAAKGADRGLTGWSLRGVASGDLDGLATTSSDRPPPRERPTHPNGVTELDHVVAITPALERTVAALQGAGLDLRRIREEPTPAGAPRQAFFRLGATILEVVQEPPEAIERAGGDHPAFFWGLAFVAPDLEETVAGLRDRVGEIRPAVQPGRRIATLRRSAGLALPVALMGPDVEAG
jgi:hypothetical protein